MRRCVSKHLSDRAAALRAGGSRTVQESTGYEWLQSKQGHCNSWELAVTLHQQAIPFNTIDGSNWRQQLSKEGDSDAVDLLATMRAKVLQREHFTTSEFKASMTKIGAIVSASEGEKRTKFAELAAKVIGYHKQSQKELSVQVGEASMEWSVQAATKLDNIMQSNCVGEGLQVVTLTKEEVKSVLPADVSNDFLNG